MGEMQRRLIAILKGGSTKQSITGAGRAYLYMHKEKADQL
jgi:hypothetical protein